MPKLTVRIIGAEHIMRNLNRDQLMGPPWTKFLGRSTLALESQARKNAP